jgi:hypothetical protein
MEKRKIEGYGEDSAFQRWKSQRIKIHRLADRFFNPYPRVWIFVWKSQRFGKRVDTFDSQIFVLRFLKSIGWNGFPMNFWLLHSL